MGGRSMDPEVAALVERGLEVVPRVVASLAAQFPRHVERAELIRAGALGVVEAAWRFDPARGVPFERFAAHRIRGAVLDAVRSEDWAPRSVRSAARRIELVEQSLTARHGRPPTIDELAAESGTTVEQVAKVRSALAASRIGRLDHRRDPDGSAPGEVIEPVDTSQPDALEILERTELLAYLREAIDALPRRQRQVILGQFVEGRSTEQLATELGVTRSRISQLRTDALHELRRTISGRYGPMPPRKDQVPPTRAAARSVSTIA